MRNVEIELLAREEIRAAANYYDEQSPGLGDRFTLAVESVLDNIAEFPAACPVLRGPYHGYGMIRFPYTLVYRFDREVVYIIAVMHQSRHPDYWVDRIIE